MYKLISFLFHPFSFLLLGTLLLFHTNTYINFSYSDQLKMLVYIVIIINTMIVPVAIIAYLDKRNIIESILLENVKDRKIVYILNFAFYFAVLFLLSSLHVPAVVYKFAFASTLTIGALFVAALLNQKYSAHMAAFGGLFGSLFMLAIKLNTDFLTLILAVVVLSGIVGMARMKENAHSESEIYIGFLIGMCAQIFIFS